jgi:hypothetical protein
MLMNEVASAADTLELWKMINDSVWASLQQLQKAEQERKAAQKKTAAKRPSPTRGVRNPRVVQSKPQQRPPQQQQTTVKAVQQPQPQQVARVAAVPLQQPTRYGLQPLQTVPQKPA